MLEQIPARGSGYAPFDARAYQADKNRWLFNSFLRSGASDEIRPESEQGSLQLPEHRVCRLAGMSVLTVLGPSGTAVRRCVAAVGQFDILPHIPYFAIRRSDWQHVKGRVLSFNVHAFANASP